jgi:hypothetical protein
VEKISKQSIEPSGYHRQQSLGRERKKSANRALNQVGISVNRALEESGKNQQTEPWKRVEKISKQSIEPSGYERQQSRGLVGIIVNRALNQVGIMVNRALEESGKNQQTEH